MFFLYPKSSCQPLVDSLKVAPVQLSSLSGHQLLVYNHFKFKYKI
nr:MAG TPA: hypothetical protein [Caudoviricetes sp.]